MSRVPVVFVSSTVEDLKEYRAAARDAALQAGFYPSMMEYFTAAGDRPPLDTCLHKVDEADLVIVLVAHRYGWIPADQPSNQCKSITWLECEHAASKAIDVVPLFIDPLVHWPDDRREEFRLMRAVREGKATPDLLADVQRAVERLGEFKQWLDQRSVRGKFSTPDSVGRHVAHTLHEWRSRHPGFGRLEPPAADQQEMLAIYRRELVKMSRFLPLRGIDIESADPTTGSARLELARVYVTLNTRTQVPVQELPAATPRAWWRRFLTSLGSSVGSEPTSDPPVLQDPQHEKTRPMTALEAIIRNRRVVILGGPGSGKSTLLNHLTFCLAQHQLEPGLDWIGQLEVWPSDEADLIPLVVLLRDFARTLHTHETGDVQRPDLLWQFIQSRLEALNLRAAVPALEQALEKGKALLLLDGLDEIPTSELRTIVRKAAEAFCQRYERSWHIVTCRTLSYQEPGARLEGFPSFELASLRPRQIAAFVGAWYAELLRLGQIDEHVSSAYRDRLVEAVQRPDLSQLAANPLLLTVMALVHTHKGRLPDARAQLYEEVVDILLWRWEARRGEDAVGLKALLREVGRTDSDLKRVLWSVAFECHRDGGSQAGGALSDISEASLVKALASLHPQRSLDWASRVMELMKMRAGLLLERTPGIFTFPHRTFQEYLAGTHLSVQENFVSRVKDVVALRHQPDLDVKVDTALWRNAILLAVGRLVHVTGAVERPLALAAELCPLKLDPAKATKAETRLAWLAGEVLTEVGPARSSFAIGQELAERVPRIIAALLGRGLLTPVERRAMGNILANLGDPRFCSDSWYLPDDPLLGFVEIPADVFRMGTAPQRDTAAYDDEQPAHDLDVGRFYIARWPVTVAQFRAFVEDHEANGGFAPGDPDRLHGVDNHPVVRVSWDEARQYCRWLTDKLRSSMSTPAPLAVLLSATDEGRNWQVGLASEAEWEKAARGTDGRIYPWGDEPDANRANYVKSGINRTSAVGCFGGGASPYGVEELSGNVWEWTRSLYRSYPYVAADGREDPHKAGQRVVRGGSFHDRGEGVRVAYRGRYERSERSGNLGFRVVLSRF